jgi:hypothetical protein
MRFVVFAPKHNTKGRSDATGAFQLEALGFLRHHGVNPRELILVDNSSMLSTQRSHVLREINTWALCKEPVCIAFFCHGSRNGIQLGFKSKHIGRLASSIAALGDPGVRVALYSCDCGRDIDRERIDDLAEHGGNGGFADLLRDALCKAGCVDCMVWAHTTAGHTSKNPHVRLFAGLGSSIGGDGGIYVVPRHWPQWKRWRAELRTPFRWDYPLMTLARIHAQMAG